MADGVFVANGGIVAVVYGFTGLPPSGQTFLALDPTGLSPGQMVPPLAAKIAAGIAITCTGTPAVSATYALDAVTLAQIGSVARDFASGLGLPGGGSTFTYPDITGTPHGLTGAQVVALYKAQRDLLLVLDTQAAAWAHGTAPVWPAQTATIA